MAGIGRDEIASGLRSLGLHRQSTVVVHSSLRSFGTVEGGAEAVAASLVEVCGTVVAPSGTWDLTGVPGPPGLHGVNNACRSADSWDSFDAALDRAVPFSADLPIDKELGAVPEALRVGYPHCRGAHPLFSFLAVGPAAAEIVAKDRLDWPLGPLEAVEALDGQVLLLGVGHTRNTSMHLAEQRLGRSRFYRYAKVGPSVWAELPNIPGHSHSFDDIEPVLRRSTRGLRIGECRARLIAIWDVLDAVTTAVLADPGALLCEDPECRCGAARCQREAVLSSA